MELTESVLQELDELSKQYIVLVTVDADDYLKVNLDLLKYLCNEKELYGIYVSVNRPYKSSLNIMQNKNIKTDRIFFIDCISPLLGETSFRDERCLFTSPDNLTDVAVLVDEWVRSLEDTDKFLFLDSLSTLLLYNTSGTVTKFFHFLTGKMRQWNLNGVLMSLEKESNPELLDDISQFCDKKINLSSGGD